jgi:hypothetical protein
MNQPPAPPLRVQPLPIAQLINKLPGTPKPGESAYDHKYEEGEKGGLPMEIVAFAQGLYVPPQIPPAGQQGQPLAPQPGWGGQGR